MKIGDKVRVKATGQEGSIFEIEELGISKLYYTIVNSDASLLFKGKYQFMFGAEELEPLNEPTDQYADLDLSEELPSSEVVNESEGVTCCPLLKLLDDTKDQVQGDQPEPTFEAKMLAYYDEQESENYMDMLENHLNRWIC